MKEINVEKILREAYSPVEYVNGDKEMVGCTYRGILWKHYYSQDSTLRVFMANWGEDNSQGLGLYSNTNETLAHYYISSEEHRFKICLF